MGKVLRSQLDELEARLNALDEPSEVSKQKAVEHLLDAIEAALRRGQTLRAVCAALQSEIPGLTLPTLKNCLQRARGRQSEVGVVRRACAPEQVLATPKPERRQNESAALTKPPHGVYSESAGRFTPRLDRRDI